MTLHTQFIGVNRRILTIRFLLAMVAAISLGLMTPVHTVALGTTQQGTSTEASGCVVPLFAATPIAQKPESVVTIKPEWYANAVVGAIEVINPQNALGVEDTGWAVLTETSVLTLSFPSPFISGVAAVVQNPDESNCSWVWITIRHYLDLAAAPIFTTTTYTYVTPGYPGWIQIGDGLSASMAPHRYVAISFNTITLVDAVHYIIPAKNYWMPVMMRNAS